MFNLLSFNERASDARMTVPGGPIDRLTFDPHLLRPYRARARRHTVNGRYAEYGPERVWVNVYQGTEVARDSSGSPIVNESGITKVHDVFEPQLVQDRRNRDLPVINGYVTNANTLRKDQWIMMDQKLLDVRRKRLNLWNIMRARNTLGGIDGMATPILEFERLVDAGEAVVSMSPRTRGNNFNPTFELDGTPLPITHCDFDIDARFLAISRARGGTSAELTRGVYAALRTAELVEMTALGVVAGVQYGDATDWVSTVSKVYGLLNHPDRITKTNLTASATITGANFLSEIVTSATSLMELARAKNIYGPFELFVSGAYNVKMDEEFKAETYGSTRKRLMEIGKLSGIIELDYLTGDVMILVEFGEDIEAINGMEFITVQRTTTDWEELSFKHMGIQVPRIRSRNINTGTTGPATSTTAVAPVVHGTTS